MSRVDTPTIEGVFREESGRVVATLVRQFGDIDLAEEAVQDAFATAVEQWTASGLPPNPGGWITTTARRRAIDRFRRESSRSQRQKEAAEVFRPDESIETGAVGDDRLRLIFTCCHPALAPASRVALTLRLLGGLTTPEIADAFLVPEATMAQRLVRAKRKISATKIPYRVPGDAELPNRLGGVLAVLYLIYNEGHRTHGSADGGREDLCLEAIRLGRVLTELMPDEPEAVGLLALLLLTQARRTARTTADGTLVPLSEQDRTTWDEVLIAEGHELVRACLRRDQPGPYQLQAAIAAVHADAATAADTDWAQIVALYDQLLTVAPTPVVALNRGAALAEWAGPAEALEAVEELDLGTYQPYHATRADLLRRLHRHDEAAEAYRLAVELSTNPSERTFLEDRLAQAIAAGRAADA